MGRELERTADDYLAANYEQRTQFVRPVSPLRQGERFQKLKEWMVSVNSSQSDSDSISGQSDSLCRKASCVEGSIMNIQFFDVTTDSL